MRLEYCHRTGVCALQCPPAFAAGFGCFGRLKLYHDDPIPFLSIPWTRGFLKIRGPTTDICPIKGGLFSLRLTRFASCFSDLPFPDQRVVGSGAEEGNGTVVVEGRGTRKLWFFC